MNARKHSLAGFIYIVFGLIMLYAVLRNHIFVGLPWSELPLYTINKAAAWAALNFIGLAFAASVYRFFENNKFQEFIYASAYLIHTGLFFLSLHIGISGLLLISDYFSQIFEADGSLTTHATVSFFFAVFSLLLLLFYLFRSKDVGFVSLISQYSQKLFFPAVVFFLILIHPFFMGFNQWFQNMEQANYLPRVSFLAMLDGFSVLVLILYFTLKVRRQMKSEDDTDY